MTSVAGMQSQSRAATAAAVAKERFPLVCATTLCLPLADLLQSLTWTLAPDLFPQPVPAPSCNLPSRCAWQALGKFFNWVGGSPWVSVWVGRWGGAWGGGGPTPLPHPPTP